MLGSAPRQEGDRRWGLVHKQPVEMKLLDSLPELLKIHWLLDIAVHAPVIAADQILFFQGRSEDNHRDHLRAGVALDRAEHFQSVHFGQLQVQERSEEHTSELQSLAYLVCRLLLEKKK